MWRCKGHCRVLCLRHCRLQRRSHRPNHKNSISRYPAAGKCHGRTSEHPASHAATPLGTKVPPQSLIFRQHYYYSNKRHHVNSTASKLHDPDFPPSRLSGRSDRHHSADRIISPRTFSRQRQGHPPATQTLEYLLVRPHLCFATEPQPALRYSITTRQSR